MDKIGQLERNLWEIFEDPKTTQMGKVKMIRELHKLVITSTLMLRDLPFLTNLSKCYDSNILNTKDSKFKVITIKYTRNSKQNGY